MSKRTFWVAAVGLVAILVTGGLFASNMGFKLNYTLSGPGAFPQNGTNTIALPYNQQTNLLNALDLINDIGGTGTVIQVSKYNVATNALESYSGTSGSPFNLVPGECYRVQVNADTQYTIAGSHDPSLQINLQGPAAFPQNGTNTFAYPYHSTSVDALDLINEAGGTGVVVQVSRYNKATNALESYSGTSGTPFALTPGECYRIQVNTNTSFTPSHF
jgi:hypothetical protein